MGTTFWVEHIKTELVQAIILNATQDTTLIEVYSCNIQVTAILDMQKDLKVMSLNDLIMAQSHDPIIREI